MTYTETLARTVLFVIYIGGAIVVAWLVWSAVRHTGPFGDGVHPQTGTAGLDVETDAGTGCQYIVTPWGGIVPRTGADGRQICLHR